MAIKKRPCGAPMVRSERDSDDRGAAVADAGELGLMQALGLQDPLADQDEVVHNVPPQRQPRSLLPRHASRVGMNVLKK